ncbi:MAG: hypothetical protein ACRD0K_06905 [Egibacteraceae bacterium]
MISASRPASETEVRPRRLMPPPAIPHDIDEPRAAKAAGVVQLPHHVRWSGPERSYDLDNRRDRARVYEQVLQEGTEEDIRFFIDLDALIELWEELYLPPHVRQTWTDRLAGQPPQDPPVMLSALQRRLIGLISSLPEAEGFALAGGAALVTRGEVSRTTKIWTSSRAVPLRYIGWHAPSSRRQSIRA